MNMYTKGYNAYGQNGLAYDYYTIWGGDLDIKGSDGG